MESNHDASLELVAPLQDSAHPGLYRSNAFRVLELHVDASARELTKRRQIVEAASGNGLKIPPGPGRVLPLHPAPDAFAAREAVQRLTDPERRLVDEFFWFWPHQLGSARDDEALQQLSQGNSEAAELLWRRQEREQSQSLVSTHNLAVLFYIRALESAERLLRDSGDTAPENGKDDSRFQPKADGHLWEEAFRRWGMLMKEEGFWSRLTARIRELDDPRLPTGTSRRIRSGLPLALLAANAKLALKAAEQGRLDLAQEHVRTLRSSPFSPAVCDAALALAVEPVRARLKNLCRTATKETAENAENGVAVAKRLLEQSKDLLAIVDCLLPEHHPTRGAVHDDVAIAALDCSIVFSNKIKKYRECLPLFETMVPIASSQSLKERLRNNYDILKGNVEYSQCFFCKAADQDDAAAFQVKMHGNVRRVGNSIQWQHCAVKVPRCPACKQLHARLENANAGMGCGGFLAVAAGIVAAILLGNNETGGFLALLLVAVAAGAWCVWGITHKPVLTGVLPPGSRNEHPRIKELLGQGWKWGDRPQTN